MITDAALGRARAATVIPYGVRVVVTMLALGLYWFGHRVPLPSVDEKAFLSTFRNMDMSILMLGLNPLLTGFVLVELFSLLTSPGRRLRRGGAPGRGRLNRAALITSLVIAAIQAASISIYLGAMVSPGGAPVVTNPGLAFRVLVIVTLTAVTAAVFVLGKLLSGYGIGNGFVLLLLAESGLSSASGLSALGAPVDFRSTGAVVGLLLAASLLLLLFRFLQKADDAWLPAFPQGILPAYLGMIGASYLLTFIPRLGEPLGDLNLRMPVITLFAILLLSWAGFHLFSSRRRLAADLPEPNEALDDLGASLRRQTVTATTVLAFGTAALMAWQLNAPLPLASPLLASFSFPGAVLLMAVLLDLWDQYRFQRRHPGLELLVALDNVHFSYWLEGRLQEEGIDALARGHRLRSLFFFLGPLFKIDVLVAGGQLGRARDVLAELEVAPEVKVF
ncbi:MAG TPA: hypothetical protein VGX68_28125 [Thermoanaerobaculia bacterium]|jgi:preprotein translocase subunit SecY|nr:hypothetical protein [Thermoanaerobaculia bacterium]